MIKDFLEALKVELTGVIPDVRIGFPREDKESKLEDVTIYISPVNIDNTDRQRDVAIIRVVLSAFGPKIEGDEDKKEEYELEAIAAIDEVFLYLDENRKTYNLIATPENLSIWSSFRIPLRPFLVYECSVNLPN